MVVVRRFVKRNIRCLFELGVVRSLLGELRGIDRVGSCKENVRRNVRYLIELGAVRSLLGEMRGIR